MSDPAAPMPTPAAESSCEWRGAYFALARIAEQHVLRADRLAKAMLASGVYGTSEGAASMAERIIREYNRFEVPS